MSTTSLLAPAAYGTTTVEEGSGGVAEQATTEKGEKKSVVYHVISWIMPFIGWAPLVIILSVPNKRIALTASAGTALVSFCLSGIHYKMGGTKTWPKVMDISFLCTFGLLTILAWSLPSDEAVADITAFLDLFIFGGFAVTIAIAWACFKLPFAEQMLVDHVSEEELSHPGPQYLIKKNTQMFLIGFTLMAGFGGAMGALTITNNLTNTLRIVLLVLEYSILGIMLTIAFWLLPAYIFSEKGQNMLDTVYSDEIVEWNNVHPDHEWAHEDSSSP